jgi:hypothetical protein
LFELKAEGIKLKAFNLHVYIGTFVNQTFLLCKAKTFDGFSVLSALSFGEILSV